MEDVFGGAVGVGLLQFWIMLIILGGPRVLRVGMGVQLQDQCVGHEYPGKNHQ